MRFARRFLPIRTYQTCLATLAIAFGMSAAARADGVTIESSNPAQSIKLQVSSATVHDVLQALHDQYQIEISGENSDSANDPISVTFQGSLPDILKRLLRNENYVVIRSAANVTGIGKILITANLHTKDPKSVPAQQSPITPATP